MLRSTIDDLAHLRRPPDLSRLALSPDNLVFGALEVRSAGDRYDWSGDKRHADPAHPYVLFQCTLEGWGAYAEGGSAVPVKPGQAFCAAIPSEHRYFLPADSAGWTFVWVFIHHPYVVGRIIERRRGIGALIPAADDSALFARMIRLLDLSRTSVDSFSVEQATFDFLIEYERVAHSIQFSEPARDRLLSSVRDYVIANLRRRFDVEALADAADMSRSHYAHHFKATVGVPPGRYITQVRLEEATRLLADPNLKLEAIADETGFADANHLCKVFRRHFHISPGEFRRRYPG